MTMIAAAVARIVVQSAPVIIVDTCNFLDLFRPDPTRRPRVPAEEIQIASELLQLTIARPDAIHLVVPELVPIEFVDHANRIEKEFDEWLKSHDENQAWLAQAGTWVKTPLPTPSTVHPSGLSARLRQLADDLLAHAVVLDRDSGSLDRAVARLLAKRRPSHSKEIKDSMNMEQSLELCRQLKSEGYLGTVAFISSNTKDFAATSTNAQLHGDLDQEFAAVFLKYFPNFRTAVRSLRAQGELP